MRICILKVISFVDVDGTVSEVYNTGILVLCIFHNFGLIFLTICHPKNDKNNSLTLPEHSDCEILKIKVVTFSLEHSVQIETSSYFYYSIDQSQTKK